MISMMGFGAIVLLILATFSTVFKAICYGPRRETKGAMVLALSSSRPPSQSRWW